MNNRKLNNYYVFLGKPKEPLNIHYSYKSTNTTQNRFAGGYPPNDESQPLLPQKFPTDDSDGPPKRLDELMATIGNEVSITLTQKPQKREHNYLSVKKCTEN